MDVKKIILCLLVFSLFISTNSQESSKTLEIKGTETLTWIDFDYTTNSAFLKVTDANHPSQNFALYFENDIPRSVDYIRVDLKVLTSNVPTPILHFSSIDENCLDGRQQIAKNPNSDTATLWLKVEEFQDGDLYISVECLTDATTDYSLTFTGTSQIEMGSSFIYSYLVGSGNKDMTFFADFSSEDIDAVSFYAVGSKSVTINVDGVEKATKFSLGSALTIKPEEINSSQYSITVSAAEGDYVFVGINNIKDSKNEGELLIPNGPEVSGFLKRGVLEDQCFEMASLEELYKNKNIYINGRIYNKVAEVYLRDSNFKIVDDSEKLVSDGFYNENIPTNGKKLSICIRFPEETYESLKNIPFSFSVVEPT